MKRALPLLALLVGCGFTPVRGNENPLPRPASKVYGVKSGIYEITTPSNTWVVYFDDYGARKAAYPRAPSFTTGANQNVVSVDAEGWEYEYELGGDTATRTRQMPPKSFDPSGFSADDKRARHFKELPRRTISGKDCVGYQVQDGHVVSRIWSWRGLPMHMEISWKGAAPFLVDVSNLKADVAVPKEKLELPAGIKVVDTNPNQ